MGCVFLWGKVVEIKRSGFTTHDTDGPWRRNWRAIFDDDDDDGDSDSDDDDNRAKWSKCCWTVPTSPDFATSAISNSFSWLW